MKIYEMCNYSQSSVTLVSILLYHMLSFNINSCLFLDFLPTTESDTDLGEPNDDISFLNPTDPHFIENYTTHKGVPPDSTSSPVLSTTVSQGHDVATNYILNSTSDIVLEMTTDDSNRPDRNSNVITEPSTDSVDSDTVTTTVSEAYTVSTSEDVANVSTNPVEVSSGMTDHIRYDGTSTDTTVTAYSTSSNEESQADNTTYNYLSTTQMVSNEVHETAVMLSTSSVSSTESTTFNNVTEELFVDYFTPSFNITEGTVDTPVMPSKSLVYITTDGVATVDVTHASNLTTVTVPIINSSTIPPSYDIDNITTDSYTPDISITIIRGPGFDNVTSSGSNASHSLIIDNSTDRLTTWTSNMESTIGNKSLCEYYNKNDLWNVKFFSSSYLFFSFSYMFCITLSRYDNRSNKSRQHHRSTIYFNIHV